MLNACKPSNQALVANANVMFMLEPIVSCSWMADPTNKSSSFFPLEHVLLLWDQKNERSALVSWETSKVIHQQRDPIVSMPGYRACS